MRIGGIQAEDALATVGADQSQLLDIRVGAVVALGFQSTPTSFDKLRALTASDNPEIKARSIVFLSRRFPAEYLPALVDASMDVDLDELVMDKVVNQLERVSGVDFTGEPIGWSRLSTNQRKLVRERIAEWWAADQR
jgi:hypothetical protein